MNPAHISPFLALYRKYAHGDMQASLQPHNSLLFVGILASVMLNFYSMRSFDGTMTNSDLVNRGIKLAQDVASAYTAGKHQVPIKSCSPNATCRSISRPKPDLATRFASESEPT